MRTVKRLTLPQPVFAAVGKSPVQLAIQNLGACHTSPEARCAEQLSTDVIVVEISHLQGVAACDGLEVARRTGLLENRRLGGEDDYQRPLLNSRELNGRIGARTDHDGAF